MPLDGQIENFTREPNETKPLTEVQKVLFRAAEIIEERGWCQNQGINERGEVCWASAICYAWRERQHPFPHPLDNREFVKFIGGKDGWHAQIDWNDAPGRTKEEVIEALRAAASGREGK